MIRHNHTIFVTTPEALWVVAVLIASFLAVALTSGLVGYRQGAESAAVTCPESAVSQIQMEDGQVDCILIAAKNPAAVYKRSVIRKGRAS